MLGKVHVPACAGRAGEMGYGARPGVSPFLASHARLEEESTVNVADAEHADQLLSVDNGNAAKILQTHVGSGFQDRITGADRERIRRHDLFHLLSEHLRI